MKCDHCLYQSINQCDAVSEVQDYIDPSRRFIIDTNTFWGQLLMWLVGCKQFKTGTE